MISCKGTRWNQGIGYGYCFILRLLWERISFFKVPYMTLKDSVACGFLTDSFGCWLSFGWSCSQSPSLVASSQYSSYHTMAGLFIRASKWDISEREYPRFKPLGFCNLIFEGTSHCFPIFYLIKVSLISGIHSRVGRRAGSLTII